MRLVLCSVLVPFFAGCVRPTEERAESDREVGSVNVAGSRFRVEGGLAAVRSAKPGEVVLWASAPALRLHVDVGDSAAGPLRLELQNCLSDTELRAFGAGVPVDVEALPSSIPTRKFWSVSLPAGGSFTLVFEPPDTNERAPFRFAVLSDIQEALDRLSDIHAKLNAEPEIRFLLGAGDLTERGTREQLERYQRELTELEVPYFTTLGNHELGQEPTLWHEYFGRGSFHFGFRGVEFSLLDSASASIDPIVYEWLDTWLVQARGRVHVVAMHIPPVDPIGVRNGSFANRNEAAKLLTRLARGRVDLTLYGHIHSYYAFENAGIPAHISGGGGAIPERFDGIGRHFLVVDVDPSSGIREVRIVRVD
ncbi:MAG TPA: metallophosphoesterase [Polyangiaceae bacterium]|nr:metallophosphoesterase [Polyangiaceae bacterium]